MSLNAYNAFSILIKEVSKRKFNPIVDGYGGFLFVNQNGQVMSPNGIASSFRHLIDAYNKSVDETKKLPKEEQKKRAIKNLHAIGIMDKEGNLIESHPLFPYIEEKTELQKEK